MKEEKEKTNNSDVINFQTIKCENCGGDGVLDGKKCALCNGIGIAFWFNGSVFYWGRKFSWLNILENKIEKIVNKVINSTLLLFGIAGYASLAYYAYKSGIENITTKGFWANGSPFLLFFWASLIVDMYLVYRFDKESLSVVSVVKKKYGETGNIFVEGDQWEHINRLPKKSKIDISRSFNTGSINVLEESWKLANKFDHLEVRPIHILASLLFSPNIDLVFARLGVDMKVLAKKINKVLNAQEFLGLENHNNVVFSTKLNETLFNAYIEAYKSGDSDIDVVDILLAVVGGDSSAQDLLYDLKVDFDMIKNVSIWIKINNELLSRSKEFRKSAIFKPKSGMDRAMTAVATPFLDRFSQDMTLLAKFGYLEPCVGRNSEIEDIFRAIEANRQSVILSGNHGVGKSSIVGGIARRMVSENVPDIIKDKRLISLNIARLISGASPDEALGRLMQIIDEIKRAGNIVLFISNIQDMVGITSGTEESLDLSEVLVSEISSGSFFVLATTLSSDYAKYIEGTSLGSSMQRIEVLEPTQNDAIQILEAKTAGIEYKNNVYFSYDAIEQAVKLSSRYMHDRFLPEKAIDIIEQAALYISKKRGGKSVVLGSDIASLISEKIKIPLTTVTEEESKKLLNLEEKIHNRVIGQDEAVKMVSAALRRSRAELRDIKRPIANFLFLGPTGVGKTELAKTVAEVYFGSEKNMTRLDMSEYQEKSSVNRLIGSPPGSGGVGTGGYLTEAIRKKPFTLLLLDELEKAHPDILNIFLQLMEDGRLTDGLGRTVDFTNVILIATSNAGTGFIQDKINEGWTAEKVTDALLEGEIKKSFRPEFINRFDGVIVFKPLTMSQVFEIAKLMIGKVSSSMKEKGINFTVTDDFVNELTKEGFDPQYGARPLRRVIQERVKDYLANYLLRGKLDRRDTVILGAGGKIDIKKAKEL